MRDTCIVITWLAKDQPGFLDFSYRVRSLAKLYDTLLVSPYPLVHPEFAIDGVEHCVLAHDMGRAGWIAYMLDCARLIRARRPNCAILLHSMVAPLAWLTGRTPTALYWNEHPSRFTASPPGHPWYKRLARKIALKACFMQAAKRTEMVMPIGEAHEADLLASGFRPDRVQRIYMGVDSTFRIDRANDIERNIDAPLELIYIGTVNHLRGRDVMLEAIALANRECKIARLTVYGASDDQIEYCKTYAYQHGIADMVTVHGRIAGSAIPGALRDVDLGLSFMADFPWWRLNPPTKLFEYLVAGLPVLASDLQTNTHYIRDWENGLICRYEGIHLAQRLHELWQRRSELAQLKQQARDSGQQYLWDGIEPLFLQTVKSIARPSAHAEGAGEQKGLLVKQASSVDSARSKS